MTDEKDISKAAKLVMLHLSDEEKQALASDWANVMRMIERIKEADITSVEPLFHPLQTYAPSRADEVTEENQRELLQENAPETKEGFYIVPRFVE